MRLTMQDKNEFLKAAVKAPDRESLARWLVSVVDAIDAAEREAGKADASVSCPPYAEPATAGHVAARTAARPAGQEWAMNGTLVP